MDLNNPSLSGFLIFWGYTILYLVCSIILQYKLNLGPKRKRIQFKEDAIRDGRMVTAHLDDFNSGTHIPNEDNRFTADYIYTAPDGSTHQYHTSWYAKWAPRPPITVPLYLYPDDYSKFYTPQELDMGKHNSQKGCLTLLAEVFLYFLLLRLLIIR